MAIDIAQRNLTPEQLASYNEDGFLVLRGIFELAECDVFRRHMTKLETGEEQLDGFAIQEMYRRSFNQHLYDPLCESWMIHPRPVSYTHLRAHET